MSDRDSMSGWGDEKSAPLIVAAPGAAAASSGRVTTMLMGGALVIALAIAGYAVYRIDADNRAHAKAVEKINKDYGDKIRVLDDKLARASAWWNEDKDYIAALEADNVAMASGKKPASNAPTPPARQKYIDDLEKENATRRDPNKNKKPVEVTKPPIGFQRDI